MGPQKHELRPSIYICVEVKNRELDSQLLLAAELTQRGFRCLLGSHAAIFALLKAKKTKSGIFFDKGTLPRSRMEWIKTKVDSIVVMDQELGPTLENPSSEFASGQSRIYPGVEEFVDKYLCVGPKVYEAALKHFGGDKEKVVMTGWPRIDIWNKLGKEIYKSEIELLTSEYGKFVLFVSDFGVNKDAEVTFEGIKSLSQFDENFQSTLRVLKNWDNSSDFDRIVIRPHITEDVNLWEKLLGQLTKTVVKKEFNVTPWVLASSGIIHTGSTVALEARLAGKSVFYLRENSTRGESSFADLVSNCVIQGDFKGPLTIKEYPNQPLPSEIYRYVFLNEISATSRVIDEFEKLKPKSEPNLAIFSILVSQIYLSSLRRLAGLIKDEIAYKLRIISNPPYSHSFPGGIARKDITKVLTSNKNYNGIRVRRVTINCWEFI